MREKKEAFIVTFRTTTGAMADPGAPGYHRRVRHVLGGASGCPGCPGGTGDERALGCGRIVCYTALRTAQRRGSERGACMAGICEECVHYDYDEELDAYYCTMDLDEDEMERFLRSANNACPFYRRGDDYETARRQ